MKFSFKKNIIIIVIAAVLAIGAGVGAVAIGISNSPANRVSRYMGAAERYLSELDYEQAIIEFDRILEIDPMNVEAYLGKAQAYLALGDTENALKWLKKGFEMTGDKRLQDKIDEINNKPETPGTPAGSGFDESEAGSGYTHDEVANMLLNYFNGTGDVDKDMLKSIKTFGVKPSGFDVVLDSEQESYVLLAEPYRLGDNEFFTECPINSFEKMGIVADMTNCFRFYIDGIATDDYSAFANFEELRLNVFHCVTDVTPFSSLTNLVELDLWENQITDISPLANLTNLTDLNLSYNQISDISPLANLTNLTDLNLFATELITDISPLANLTNLQYLDLTRNQITDLSPLSNLTNLTWLHATTNNITDISPVANLTNLTSLRIGNNNITNLSPVANLTNLKTLLADGNKISDISPLANLTNLTWLDLGSNQISDISPLSNLTNLDNLNLGGNQMTDISPLFNLTKLTKLRWYGNHNVSDADIDRLKQQLPNCDCSIT